MITWMRMIGQPWHACYADWVARQVRPRCSHPPFNADIFTNYVTKDICPDCLSVTGQIVEPKGNA